MKTAKVLAFVTVTKIWYVCPYCLEEIKYETHEEKAIKPKGKCHKCLKPLRFKVMYI